MDNGLPLPGGSADGCAETIDDPPVFEANLVAALLLGVLV